MNNVYIIAEAGVNHNGDINMALELVDMAAKAGADAIKFQTFIPENVISKHAEKAEYQLNSTNKQESQLDMVRKLYLSEVEFIKLKERCLEKSIEFISSPFDMDSIETLTRIGVNKIKIPSGEITNLPYLRKVGKLNISLIVSTGMSNVEEIDQCIKILCEAGTSRDKISILHCNTEYPTPAKDANLNAIITIKNEFKLITGYSDHTCGIHFPVAAVALGAQIIEKHFTLDRTLEGPDHIASIEVEELSDMVKAIRDIEKGLGSGVKVPSPSEIKNIVIARKSLVAKEDINKGDIFSENNLTIKRPGTGISPMNWDEYIGKVATHDFYQDDLIHD